MNRQKKNMMVQCLHIAWVSA